LLLRSDCLWINKTYRDKKVVGVLYFSCATSVVYEYRNIQALMYKAEEEQ
jgi:hypothetical protein